MTPTSIVLGSREWLIPAVIVFAVGVVATVWSYLRWRGRRWVAVVSAALKVVGLAAIALCLVEPLLTGTRSQPGENVFVVLVDNSQSLQVREGNDGTRADTMKALLDVNADWRTRLGQDFDTRNFAFDTHLRSVDGYERLEFDGTSSSLHAALASVTKRFQGRPLAGVILLSDGNATDTDSAVDWSSLPPVFPVLPADAPASRDVAVRRVTLNQTNFEAAPVALQTEIATTGFAEQPITVVVSDEAGKEVARQEAKPATDDETLALRFQVRPEKSGVVFYRVTARLSAELKKANAESAEPTLANNTREVVVDRGGGPYRVLYVCGRPNWEFKYLRRAVDEDREVQLVGLVRVARREQKFDFRDPRARPDNPLFKGFDNPDADTAERRDQPVLIRLNTEDEVELRGGFPQAAADLYRYHAVILDDVEAEFFTPDQQLLLRNFVARRGGGCLMLGGPDSFVAGKYDRTPIGDLLPVYLDDKPRQGVGDYQMVLTREGWLQPWVRTRKTEAEEAQRFSGMPAFHTLNTVGDAKPGATVLAHARNSAGQELPALVAQPFGKGRSAAMLIGDLWRWSLRRTDPKEDDFDRAWRQTVRWLVADVPGRVELRATPTAGTASPAVALTVRATDAEFLPLDNATVSVRVTKPNREELTLSAESDASEAGEYGVRFVPREPGAYRATATVTAPDGSLVGRREIGWCVQPEADEFARLEPNRDLLSAIAGRTGGETVPAEKLNEFVAGLPFREAPNMEAWVTPLWHRAWYFLVAVGCLVAEWGLRRRFGMA